MSNTDLFDLDLGVAAEDGAPMELVHPTTGVVLETDGRPIRIFLKGNDSATFRNRMDFHMRRNRKGKDQTLAEMEQQSADLLSYVTTGWEGIMWQGEPIPFTRENAKKLYLDRPWIRKQVDEFVAEAENFFKGSSSN